MAPEMKAKMVAASWPTTKPATAKTSQYQPWRGVFGGTHGVSRKGMSTLGGGGAGSAVRASAGDQEAPGSVGAGDCCGAEGGAGGGCCCSHSRGT